MGVHRAALETQSSSDYPGGSRDGPRHRARVMLVPVEGNWSGASSVVPTQIQTCSGSPPHCKLPTHNT